MGTLLHIGKKRVQTLTASDASAIPAGTVTAVANAPQVTVSVNPANNEVSVTGVTATAQVQVTYSAPGYLSATQLFTVAPLPNLIVTDGPEQLA
jgi:hypothetical protein